MDWKLIEAAEEGDVEKLHNLIKEYPLILKAVALWCGNNPLHMACMGGHLPFVKEVLKLGRPNFLEEMNVDGFSPLHIASATGDPEVVKELLKKGTHLCLLKGIAKKIPLHCAVSKGKTEVMSVLLLARPDSITQVTVRGETCFHLALKNNQFEAFKVLSEYGDIEDVLNSKDQQGNSIWHLLASSKIQYEVSTGESISSHLKIR